MTDPCVIDARDFGLKADGVTDDLPALNAALAAFPFDGLHYQFGGKLLLPSGNILLSDTWLIDRIVDVCGVTGHSNGRTNIIAPRTGNPAVWFVSKVDSPRWQEHPTWEVLGGGSVQDLVVQGQGDFTKTGQHGVKTHTSVAILNVWAANLGGDGVHIASNESDPTGNCNGSYLERVLITGCGGNGVYVSGGDCNAILGAAVYCQGNGGWGIYDAGFLGNTWLSCLAEANVVGAYATTSPAARTNFIGCYAEGDQPKSWLAQACCYIGGDHGPRFEAPPGSGLGFAMVAARYNHLTWDSGNDDPDVKVGMTIGSDVAGRAAMMLTADIPQQSIFLAYDNALPSSYRRRFWSFGYGTSDVSGFALSHDNAETEGRRAIPPCRARFPTDGYYLGEQRFMTAEAEPGVGDWERGDRVYNAIPVAGGAEGWVCVSPGTFGTYAEGLSATGDGVSDFAVLSGPTFVLVPGNWVKVGTSIARVLRTHPWNHDRPYYMNQFVMSGGHVYMCLVSGTSGPIGAAPTSTDPTMPVPDNLVTWKYLGPVGRVLPLSNPVDFGTYPLTYTTPVFKPFGSIGA